MAPEDTNSEIMDGPASKRLKTSHVEESVAANGNGESGVTQSSSSVPADAAPAPPTERRKGLAPIKAEYVSFEKFIGGYDSMLISRQISCCRSRWGQDGG